MSIRHVLEFGFVRCLAALVQLFPLRAVQGIGAALGAFTFRTIRYRRRVALENLRHAFPTSPTEELVAIAEQSYRSIGITLMEFLWVPRLSQERLERLVHIENAEHIRTILAREKGAIILSAHYGNWELLALALGVTLDLPLHIIVKPQSNPLVDRMVNRRRVMFGNRVIPMGIAVREIIKALREGKVVGIVADQAAPPESVAVSFFGRTVPTHQGPAVFSLKTGAALLLGFAVRQGDGTYRARFDEVPAEDLVGVNEQNILALTERHVRATEDFIRKYPEQWMWMHRRWKHVQPQMLGPALTVNDAKG